MDQPQIQLVELGAEERVHILHAEGRRVFRAPSSCPGSRITCFSRAHERLLWFSGLADSRELQETLHALLTERRNGPVLATRRHLKYGLQPAATRVRDSDQTQEGGRRRRSTDPQTPADAALEVGFIPFRGFVEILIGVNLLQTEVFLLNPERKMGLD